MVLYGKNLLRWSERRAVCPAALVVEDSSSRLQLDLAPGQPCRSQGRNTTFSTSILFICQSADTTAGQPQVTLTERRPLIRSCVRQAQQCFHLLRQHVRTIPQIYVTVVRHLVNALDKMITDSEMKKVS